MQTTISLSKIVPSGYNPRKSFDKESLKELADSIKQKGVLQPIGVREKDCKFEIVFGERRFRAAQMAGLKDMPVIIVDASDSEAEELAITENLQREEVNEIEEGRVYESMIKEGENIASLALKFGKSEKYIKLRLQLMQLIPAFRDLVQKGELRLNAAELISSYDSSAQKEIYEKQFKGSWNPMLKSSYAQFKKNLEGQMNMKIDAERMDTKNCASCPHNTRNLLLFADEQDCDYCTNKKCLQQKAMDFACERISELVKLIPDAKVGVGCYASSPEEIVKVLKAKGLNCLDAPIARNYDNNEASLPLQPIRIKNESDKDWNERIRRYEKEKKQFEKFCQECAKSESEKQIGITSADRIWLALKQKSAKGNKVQVGFKEGLLSKDRRNAEIRDEKRRDKLVECLKVLKQNDAPFEEIEEALLDYCIQRHISYSRRDFTLKKQDSDMSKPLSQSERASLRRNFIITSMCEIGDAKVVDLASQLYAPSDFAQIKKEFDDEYDKRHKRIEERIAEYERKNGGEGA